MPGNTPRAQHSGLDAGGNGHTGRSIWLRLRESVLQFARKSPLPSHPATASEPRIGLALGGGFARGLAHIGVLKILVENRIPIHVIAGTSVGSIVGAAFASGATPKEMIEKARNIRWSSFARWTIHRLGVAKTDRMDEMLVQLFHRLRFEDLAIPLHVLATDLSTGEPVIFSHGDLILAVRGSCSFPGLFVPVEYQGRMLVDGALLASVPSEALRGAGVDAIIGVHLKTVNHRHTPTNIFQVVGQAFQIAESRNSPCWRNDCDVVIEPELSNYTWDDYEKIDEMIAEGERAAIASLPAIHQLLDQKPVGSSQRQVQDSRSSIERERTHQEMRVSKG